MRLVDEFATTLTGEAFSETVAMTVLLLPSITDRSLAALVSNVDKIGFRIHRYTHGAGADRDVS